MLVDDCGDGVKRPRRTITPKACAGPFCTEGNNFSVEGEDFEKSISNLFKNSKLGATAKIAGKMCGNLKW